MDSSSDFVGHVAKRLTQEEMEKMRAQNSRLVSEFRANKLEREAKKHWDLFYKRNDTRFFKDRHWTTREFSELLGLGMERGENVLLEVGCGVGNFVYPLIEDGLIFGKIFACDLSPRAVELMRNHALYDPEKMKIFQTDITAEDCFPDVECSVTVATLIFVLSAIHPEKFRKVVENLYNVLDNGGVVLLRDYGLYDMAQLRFKPGHKIGENFYMRQDGTRSYYFSVEEVSNLFEAVGFKTLTCGYVQRRTVNLKENIDVPRIFVQGKFEKPASIVWEYDVKPWKVNTCSRFSCDLQQREHESRAMNTWESETFNRGTLERCGQVPSCRPLLERVEEDV